MRGPTFASMFSGIGGFDIALTRAGFEKVWSNDWDRDGDGRKTGWWANRIYARHFGWEGHSADDIHLIRPDSIPDHDVLCAGFPCQPFSHAGQRRGFRDPRGTLFFEVASVAARKRPRVLLLENVRGLLSSDKGYTFLTILRELGGLGYRCEWQTLNSNWFGVPQSRERVFLVGYLGGEPAETIFPVPHTGGDDPNSPKESATALDANYYKGEDSHGQRTLLLTATNPNSRGDVRTYRVTSDSRALQAQGKGGNQVPLALTVAHTDRLNRNHPKLFSPALDGNEFGAAVMIPVQDLTHGEKGQGGKGYRDGGPSFTVQGSGVLHGIYDGAEIRYLTPLECERLQGFPDGWTERGLFDAGDRVWSGERRTDVKGREYPVITRAKEPGLYPMTDTQRYRCLGNAVTVPVVEYIAAKLRGALQAT